MIPLATLGLVALRAKHSQVERIRKFNFFEFFTVKCSWKPPKNTFLGPGRLKNMFLRILGNFNFFEKNRYKGPPCGQKNFFCSQHVQNMFFRLFNQFWVILVFSKNFDFSDHVLLIHSLWPHTWILLTQNFFFYVIFNCLSNEYKHVYWNIVVCQIEVEQRNAEIYEYLDY